ncbi:uncharacterized protein LOC116412835 isoform X2 [Galleria mellonella]|uniref:Uncharacterized protein LOC116412835 isoform X2 n=1 Tax=Galleria mellonella TaxID=7137 RepID=A0A6J3BWE6_GALME|nr:uncharacterized protein LOC116412835 isoform X2 [Galleria mellonella]
MFRRTTSIVQHDNMKFYIVIFLFCLQHILFARCSSSASIEREIRKDSGEYNADIKDLTTEQEDTEKGEDKENNEEDIIYNKEDDGVESKEGYSCKKSSECMKKKKDPQYGMEKEVADQTVLLNTNRHYYHPTHYKDFGRRFVPQYPYAEVFQKSDNHEDSRLLPKKAPPEVVMAIAKESAQLEAEKPVNPTDELFKKDLLRTGKYWNSVLVEDVNPKEVLRNYRGKHRNSKSVKTKIMPGSKLYQLVSVLKRYSPKLLYVINE